MKPYDTRKCPTSKNDLRPVSPTLIVALEAGRSPVRDNETEDCTESARRNRTIQHEITTLYTALTEGTYTVSSVDWMLEFLVTSAANETAVFIL